MRRSGPKVEITHVEIEQAMKLFFEKGGKITVLPEQKAIPIIVIGADKWSAYESLREFYL